MPRLRRRSRAFVLVLWLGLAACADRAPRVSAFGLYEGYSEARFDEWVTLSQYVEMRDGVRIAVDVTRPAVDGEAVEERLPVVWTHSRYHRNPDAVARFFGRPDSLPPIRSMVDADPSLQHLVRHGYAVAAAAVRGSGASFGTYEGLFSPDETRDGSEITEWLAHQPWSDGNVGMFGGSYLGMTQYMAASEHPPSLKAIFPNVAGLDLYDVVYPGGVYRNDMVRHWGELTRMLDVQITAPRVDADVEGTLLRRAIAEHEANWDVQREYGTDRYRDDATPDLAWQHHGPSGVLDRIQTARVPAYHFNGWYDVFVTDAVLWYANYAGPQHLTIGGWSHAGMPDSALMADRARIGTIEQHRWFDYWLKGIDNGIMDEPPIHYAIMDDPGSWTWTATDRWPPASTPTTFYFGAGPSGSVTSVNDGRLSDADAAAGGFDPYTVDFSTTTGTTTRWDNAVGAARMMVYPNLTPNDRKALTYTTAPLTDDVTVTGHPVATVYVSSSTPDAAVHVLLEEVDADGMAHYVTEGVLRISQRATADAPWNNLGLPFQRSFRGDARPVAPDDVAELQMDLHPTSTVFNAGHRIRVTVMGADADNVERVPAVGTPALRVYRGGERPSRIVLPVVR